MRRMLRWLLMPALALAGCNDLQARLARDGAIRCASSGAGAALSDLKPAAADALRAGDWQARLGSMAAAFGAEALRCALQELAGGLMVVGPGSLSVRAQSLVPAETDRRVVLERALSWLKEHP